jgi:hypothetical protein
VTRLIVIEVAFVGAVVHHTYPNEVMETVIYISNICITLEGWKVYIKKHLHWSVPAVTVFEQSSFKEDLKASFYMSDMRLSVVRSMVLIILMQRPK